MLIVRDGSLVAPKGDTVLREGDHVFVFCPCADAALVRLLFGPPEE
jgi:cell volume regulation protein A